MNSDTSENAINFAKNYLAMTGYPLVLPLPLVAEIKRRGYWNQIKEFVIENSYININVR